MDDDALIGLINSTTPPQPTAAVDRKAAIDSWLANCTDYGALIEEGIPDPTHLRTPTLGEGLVYEYALTLICGHRKAGKSHIAGVIALDIVNTGGKVLYIDYENGDKRIARRLKDLGANPKTLSERMKGHTFPEDLNDPKMVKQFLKDLAAYYPGYVIIIDAFRGYGTKAGSRVRGGFNPNDTTHIEQVLAPIADAAKSLALTIIVIDHPNRNTTKDSEYKASNSAAKEQIADAILWVDKEDKYTVEQEGSISVTASNDRDGYLPTEPQYFKVGGQGKGKPFHIAKCSALDVGTNAKIAAEVWKLLNEDPSKRFNVTAIRKVVEGKNETVAEVLAAMVSAERINYKDREFYGGPFEGVSI